MTASTSASSALHRIGTVSRLSGVPVSTLRVWEARYHTFSPSKTEGQHRLYSDNDVQRAGLLKRLTAQGHAISRIAPLDAEALQELLRQHRVLDQARSPKDTKNKSAINAVVVGLPLAARIESARFGFGLMNNALQITDVFVDLASALQTTWTQHPDVLLVRVNALHPHVQHEIERLVAQHHIGQLLVLYTFGPSHVIEALRGAGALVRREPIADTELAALLQTALRLETRRIIVSPAPNHAIPPRKYDDAMLTEIANRPNHVLCECPRHTADILMQLASFEQYSQACLHQNANDAQLHAYLSAAAGSARVLFEHALEMLAEHDGFDLPIPSNHFESGAQ